MQISDKEKITELINNFLIQIKIILNELAKEMSRNLKCLCNLIKSTALMSKANFVASKN